MIGIYKITNPSNNIYIGQSINIEKRWNDYKSLNCKKQPRIYNSLLKYGVENHKFEVLLDFDREVNTEYLTHCEQFFMDYYREEGYELMNLRDAGNKGSPSEETKNLMSKAAKNKIFTEEHKKNIGKKSKGRIIQSKRKKVAKMDLQNNILDIFNSLSEAANYKKTLACKISLCCNGKRNKTGGFKWIFYKEK